MTSALLGTGISDLIHGRAIRVALVSHNDLRIPIPPHGFSYEFQCRSFVTNLRDEGLQDFTLVVDGAPKIVSLPTDLHEDFVQMPPPLWRLSHWLRSTFADLAREVSAETVYPETGCFVTNIDAALMKQVLNIA